MRWSDDGEIGTIANQNTDIQRNPFPFIHYNTQVVYIALKTKVEMKVLSGWLNVLYEPSATTSAY